MSKLQKFVDSFPWVSNDTVPFTKLEKELKDCTVSIVSTAGIYQDGDEPYKIENREDVDESFRTIPSDAYYSDLEICHEHFNKDYAKKDLNVIYPVRLLEKLRDEGFIKEVAKENYSISGYIPKPNKLFDSAKTIAKKMKEQDVDIALIVPVWPICQQSGGLVAREIEKNGISTVTFNLIPEIISIIGIPRAITLRAPFGCIIGRPCNEGKQLHCLKKALEFVKSSTVPNEIFKI